MAFSATTHWDVRTTGNDANGGGFDLASTGTDYTQQDSPQVTYTDLAIDATTNTKITSAGTPFTSAHVGNVINVTSGTGFTVQRVQVVSVLAGVATCDKSVGTLSSTGGNGKLGGGFATIAKATGLIIDGNVIHLKNGSYAALGNTGVAAVTLVMIGYNSSHFDGGTRPLITSSTNSQTLSTITTGAGTIFININFSSTAGTPGEGFHNTNGGGQRWLLMMHCKISGCSNGITGEFNVDWDFVSSNISQPGLMLVDVEIASCTGYGVLNTAGGYLQDCYIHDNGTYGVTNGVRASGEANGAPFTLVRCLVVKNTNHGIYDQRAATVTNRFQFIGCTVAKNGGAGFKSTAPYNLKDQFIVIGSIFALNTGKGLDLATGTLPMIEERNAIYSNTGGNTTPFTQNANDITLSTDPFTNSGTGDFTLNSTSGGGAALENIGITEQTMASMSNYSDIGGLQHLGAGGGVLVNRGMQGGFNG